MHLTQSLLVTSATHAAKPLIRARVPHACATAAMASGNGGERRGVLGAAAAHSAG